MPNAKQHKPVNADSDAAVPLAGSERSSYHHGDLRNALVREGRLLLEEVGARELSLREVARRTGVSVAAPTRHFAGKEALLAALAAGGFDELAAERVGLRTTYENDPLERVRQMMRSYVAFSRRHKGLFYLMVGPTIIEPNRYAELRESSRFSFSLFATAVTDYAKLNRWPRQALTPLVYAAWTVEHGTAMLILGDRVPRPEQPIDAPSMIEFSISSFLAAVAAGPTHFRKVGTFPEREGGG